MPTNSPENPAGTVSDVDLLETFSAAYQRFESATGVAQKRLGFLQILTCMSQMRAGVNQTVAFILCLETSKQAGFQLQPVASETLPVSINDPLSLFPVQLADGSWRAIALPLQKTALDTPACMPLLLLLGATNPEDGAIQWFGNLRIDPTTLKVIPSGQ